MSAIARVLEDAGYDTFLPHRDGIEAYVMRFGRSAFASTMSALRLRIDYAIFALDVYELVDRCTGVVCNLNGRVPDEGMIVEAALAYAAGKPLVMFKDDARAPFGGYDNAMLTSLVRGSIVSRLHDIPAVLARELSNAAPIADGRTPLARNLVDAIAYGKRLSAAMLRIPESIGKKQWSEDMLAQVMEEATRNV